MEAKAKLKNLRIAPRKVRMVVDLIRGKKAKEALAILNFTAKKATSPLIKLVNSAIANAKNNFHIEADNLYISEITVDEGPKYKRWMPRARGQATPIQKKTSHINLVLKEIQPVSRQSELSEMVKKSETKKPAEASVISREEALKEAPAAEKRPRRERETKAQKPKTEKGFRRFFQRKAI